MSLPSQQPSSPQESPQESLQASPQEFSRQPSLSQESSQQLPSQHQQSPLQPPSQQPPSQQASLPPQPSSRQPSSRQPSSRQPFPQQRWHIHPPELEQVAQFAIATELLRPVAQVLWNRGMGEPELAQTFLDPEQLVLPDPLQAFPQLADSVVLLRGAIDQNHKIAICGDYDADGMTSTALLIRALRFLGGQVDYAIPSRMKEGYGINERIVDEFHAQGVRVILTVDNGIAAVKPIQHARDLGLDVIVTDHHDLPPELPPANAILNPKLLSPMSPYRGLAGVGVAYILAISLAQQVGKLQDFVNPLLELFTLGTIADLAPLTGVNRRWVKRGLSRLPHSTLVGIQALIAVSGVKSSSLATESLFNPVLPSSVEEKCKTPNLLKPDDIGFRLGPRINAIGRIGDPQVVIELLTTDNPEVAQQRALECEFANQKRRQLCEEIEQAAIALCEPNLAQIKQNRILLVMQPDWHHGVIGIVASRLVERYGVPVFIATFEAEEHHPEKHHPESNHPESNHPESNYPEEYYPESSFPEKHHPEEHHPEGNSPEEHHSKASIRGSARGIPEFHVSEALEFCTDLLTKHGGHQAAGGFSLVAQNWHAFHQRLIQFAHDRLEPQHLDPLVIVDGELKLGEINRTLFQQIDALHPWGIKNPEPVFWSRNVRIVEQKRLGKTQQHLKLLLGSPAEEPETLIWAIAWRWGHYCPLPSPLDLAYRLRENVWKGEVNVELELVGVRLPRGSQWQGRSPTAKFDYHDRAYTCACYGDDDRQELRIRNGEGQVLVIQPGQTIGLLGTNRKTAQEIDIQTPYFSQLIALAIDAIQGIT